MAIGLFVDIFVVLVVLISVSVAFLRGFIREVLTILGIVGGVVASYIGGPFLIPSMRGWMGISESANAEEAEKFMGLLPYPMLSDFLSYAIVFIFFVVILSVISNFLAEAAKNLGLGALDRTLGVVFGLARSVVVLGLLYLPVFYLVGDEEKKTWFDGSHSQVYLEVASGWIDGFFPENIEDSLPDSEAAMDAISETRKKLEAMDVLPSGDDVEKATDPKNLKKKSDGYTPDFREAMDKLIEENTDQSPDYNE